jgi:hypothetical protein
MSAGFYRCEAYLPSRLRLISLRKTIYQREGDGEEAKITVQFPRFGLKKLVEKYAQLERV